MRVPKFLSGLLQCIGRWGGREVAAPGNDPLLELYQASDEEQNDASRPPVDEHIDVHCIWLVEFYLPSHLSRFHEDMEALGWAESDNAAVPEDQSEFLSEALSSVPDFAPLVNRHIIARHGDERFPPPPRGTPRCPTEWTTPEALSIRSFPASGQWYYSSS